MAKVQPFRDESIEDRSAMRVRLNELVQVVNETRLDAKVLRVDNVTSTTTLTLPGPGFTVGAIVLGGLWSTKGVSVPTSAPWVSNWKQQQDGRITCTIGGLTSGQTYAASLVLFGTERTKT